MKYCRFRIQGDIKYGMIDADKVVEMTGHYLEQTSTPTDQVYPLNDVELLAPVEPKQLVAIGLNYVDHAKEQNMDLPKEPMMFMLSPSAIIGPNEPIKLAREKHRIDYEAELAIIIGRQAYQVSEENANDVIFGFTISNDVSDRDLQDLDKQFTRAKSFATYKPLGPVVETQLHPESVRIQLTQNGELKQNGSTQDLIHSIPKVIAAITEVMTLYPGDVVLTGTPAGVGPLSSGDEIEITIEGIGTLTNPVQ
ncbi:fumarylacetoacetate hydrolase family protein [Pullulanibacillus sp. KACC 23026]|uniref:fumarylacetoacetate hydrolase family protein n=1 Tax=Pullulanibacillus sp. KACC 23026 TaxID=3028315 RepID=UPI0023AFA2E7|nr:fumarylacetoacetate hydrolase family protein [Pullulanibacillus sp. KACC 23026]WEG13837.1 fumarylacetoacetate hydrolase family protein [Pullulanibacillus sp. KACC 23026]